jgi:hypothetical protein
VAPNERGRPALSLRLEESRVPVSSELWLVGGYLSGYLSGGYVSDVAQRK